MRMLIRLLGVAALGYAFVVAALYLGQRHLIFRPDSSRPALGPLAALGVTEATLQTADGLSLLAWYLPPPEGAPVIVYFHGNGGHLGYRVPRM
jgi:acetyl esterase/lipase